MDVLFSSFRLYWWGFHNSKMRQYLVNQVWSCSTDMLSVLKWCLFFRSFRNVRAPKARLYYMLATAWCFVTAQSIVPVPLLWICPVVQLYMVGWSYFASMRNITFPLYRRKAYGIGLVGHRFVPFYHGRWEHQHVALSWRVFSLRRHAQSGH